MSWFYILILDDLKCMHIWIKDFVYVANFSFTLTLKCDLPIHNAVDLHDDYNHISKDYCQCQ